MNPTDLITSPVWQSVPGNLYYHEPVYENQHYQCQPTRISTNEVYVGMGIGLVVVLLVCFLPKIMEKVFK